jgi:predicted transcriptional regulator
MVFFDMLTGKRGFAAAALAMILAGAALLYLALAGIQTANVGGVPGMGGMDGGATTGEAPADSAAGVILVPWQLAVGGFVLASLGLMGILFSRLREDDVLDGVRRLIFNHIEQNPGEHVAEIVRKLEISSSSARYHLLVLEYNEKVISHKSGKLKHYYSNRNGYGIYTNGFEYKDILSTLRNETARRIVRYLLTHKGANQKSIAESLGVHPSTVNWHARRLAGAQMVERVRTGKEISYALNKEVEFDKLLALIDRQAPGA